MSRWTIAGLGVLGAALAALAGWLLWRRTLPPVRAEAVITDPEDHTTVDDSGAVRSVQAADLSMREEDLVEIWSPQHLERLARTYWRFLTRCTLGLIRVAYDDDGRYVVLLTRPFVLLSFKSPEYELEEDRGIVRWRIDKGFLVSKRGRGGDGYLEIDVTRRESGTPDVAIAHVEVEVANFYPAIASGIALWVYKNTQSRIHVIVTHGFLRSLARLDFAESRIGKYAVPAAEDTPDPTRERVS